MSVTKAIRKARKKHWCGSCDGQIQPGESYLTHTAFPSDEVHYWVSQVPMRIAECAKCASRYGRGDLLGEAARDAHE